jgi:hypothetical protein
MATTDSEQTATKPDFSKTNRALIIWGAVLVAVIAITVVFVQMRAARADAERSDTYYCTLAGVGAYDKAPQTGMRCWELLDD